MLQEAGFAPVKIHGSTSHSGEKLALGPALYVRCRSGAAEVIGGSEFLGGAARAVTRGTALSPRGSSKHFGVAGAWPRRWATPLFPNSPPLPAPIGHEDGQ